MGSSLITKMWKATFIFVASCSTLILADFPFEIRHFNHMTDSKIPREWFDESCYYHCDVYEHMRPIQIMLKDGIDTCPENLLDNKVVMDSKVMYKNWCKQLDVKFCGYVSIMTVLSSKQNCLMNAFSMVQQGKNQWLVGLLGHLRKEFVTNARKSMEKPLNIHC